MKVNLMNTSPQSLPQSATTVLLQHPYVSLTICFAAELSFALLDYLRTLWAALLPWLQQDSVLGNIVNIFGHLFPHPQSLLKYSFCYEMSLHSILGSPS